MLRLSKDFMRAAVFSKPNIMDIKEVKLSQGDDKEPTVLIKVDSCAVCGYDTRVFRNGHSKVKPPIILGHEICGEVLERVFTCEETNMARLGTIEAGTRVVVCPIIP